MHGPGDVRFFHRFAGLYDVFVPPASRESLAEGFALAERPVERVLDLGGGTGRVARSIDDAETVVLDPALGMLRRARDRGLASVQADGRALPLPEGAVDAVVVVDALHHMPDQDQVVAEAARVLAPGGVLVVREFDPGTALGRGLVLAERLVGFSSTFTGPADLARSMGRRSLDATVVDDGFEYTVAGVKPPES